MFLVQVMGLDSDDFEMESKNYRCDSLTTAQKLQDRIINKYARRYLSRDWDADDEELEKVSDNEVAEWKEYNVSIHDDGTAYLYDGDSGHGEIHILELNEVVTADNVNTIEIETPFYY